MGTELELARGAAAVVTTANGIAASFRQRVAITKHQREQLKRELELVQSTTRIRHYGELSQAMAEETRLAWVTFERSMTGDPVVDGLMFDSVVVAAQRMQTEIRRY